MLFKCAKSEIRTVANCCDLHPASSPFHITAVRIKSLSHGCNVQPWVAYVRRMCSKMQTCGPCHKCKIWSTYSQLNPGSGVGNAHQVPFLRGREMSTKLFLHKRFEHTQGSGTSRQNSPDIPGSSLPNPRKTNFRGRARSFRPLSLHVEDPHPTRLSPDPKKLIFVLFFFPDAQPRNSSR